MAEFFPKNDTHNHLQQQHQQQQRIDGLSRGQPYQNDDTDGLLSSSRQHHPTQELITKKEMKMNLKREKEKEKEKDRDKSANHKKEKASKQKKEEHSEIGKGNKAPASVNPKHGPLQSQKVQQNPAVGALNESEQTAKIKILMKNVVRPLPPPPPPLNPEHRTDSRLDDSRGILYSSDMRNLLLTANSRSDEGIRAGTGTGADSGINKRRCCIKTLVAGPQSSSTSGDYPSHHKELTELSGGATCADSVTMSESRHTDIAGTSSDSEFNGSNCVADSRSEADFLGELAVVEDMGGSVGDVGGIRTASQRLLHRDCKAENLAIPGQLHTHILLPLPLSLPWKPNSR